MTASMRAFVMVAVLALVGTGGCTDERTPKGADGKLLARIRVGINPAGSWSPIFLAHAAGDFAAEGLDVEFVTALRPEESLVAVITGDLDVRPGPLSTGFLAAVARGAPIRVVAGMGVLDPEGCTYMALVTKPGLDTAGTPLLRRIRASQDGASRYVVSEMLRRRGIDLADVETIRLPEAVMVGALQDGSVDAVAVTEHALSHVAKAGNLWLAAQHAVPGFQWGVVTYSERMWRREPDLGVRFLRAYRRGIARYNAGKTDSNVAVLARMTAEAPAHLRHSCWLTMPAHARIDWPSIARFQTWAIAEGLLDAGVPASAVWDSTFVVATDEVATRVAAPSGSIQ